MNKPRPTYFASWQRVWDLVRPVRFGSDPLTLSPEAVGDLGDVLQDAAALPSWVHRAETAEALLSAARVAWASTEGKTATKQAAVCRALGITREDGKRGRVYDLAAIAHDYLGFQQARKDGGRWVAGPSREEAVSYVEKKHGIASYDATIVKLQEARDEYPDLAPLLRNLPGRSPY